MRVGQDFGFNLKEDLNLELKFLKLFHTYPINEEDYLNLKCSISFKGNSRYKDSVFNRTDTSPMTETFVKIGKVFKSLIIDYLVNFTRIFAKTCWQR